MEDVAQRGRPVAMTRSPVGASTFAIGGIAGLLAKRMVGGGGVVGRQNTVSAKESIVSQISSWPATKLHSNPSSDL
jgi:hypothetical protein